MNTLDPRESGTQEKKREETVMIGGMKRHLRFFIILLAYSIPELNIIIRNILLLSYRIIVISW